MTPKQVSSRAIFLLLLYFAWLAMMAVHEFGHVLAAYLTGATVTHVSLPLLGFSRTDVVHNTHPAIVAWGGPVGGCLLPLHPRPGKATLRDFDCQTTATPRRPGSWMGFFQSQTRP